MMPAIVVFSLFLILSDVPSFTQETAIRNLPFILANPCLDCFLY